jgi:steroid delta-isomerase-like uncharacterized protein
MTGPDNVAVVRRWTNEGFGQGRVELADELVAEDFVNHTPAPGQVPGREGLKAAVQGLRAAFPDLSVSEDDMIAQGDKVVLRDTIRGTHRGPFAGIPPTGREISISRIAIFRLVDGRIKEHWNLVDMLGALQQMGAVPAPDRPQ